MLPPTANRPTLDARRPGPARAVTIPDEELERRDWSDEERAFLGRNYPSKGAAYCARALSRTKSSIYSEAGRMELKRVGKGAPVGRAYTSLSIAQVAEGLGVPQPRVAAWIRSKQLKAALKPCGWMISRAALCRWINGNRDEINLAKVDRNWFLTLVLGPARQA